MAIEEKSPAGCIGLVRDKTRFVFRVNDHPVGVVVDPIFHRFANQPDRYIASITSR